MKQAGSRYWFGLLGVTLFVGALAGVVFGIFLKNLYPPALPFMLALFVIMTAVGQVVITRMMDQKFSRFNSAFMIYKALKMLILMAFMVIYVLFHREFALPFLISTFVMYVVFMIFESKSLNSYSRKQAER